MGSARSYFIKEGKESQRTALRKQKIEDLKEDIETRNERAVQKRTIRGQKRTLRNLKTQAFKERAAPIVKTLKESGAKVRARNEARAKLEAKGQPKKANPWTKQPENKGLWG